MNLFEYLLCAGAVALVAFVASTWWRVIDIAKHTEMLGRDLFVATQAAITVDHALQDVHERLRKAETMEDVEGIVAHLDFLEREAKNDR